MSESLYDVLGRPVPGQPSVHLGALAAPDDELAQLYATQLFGRRGENVDITVIPAGRARIPPGQTYPRLLQHHTLRSATLPGKNRQRKEER